MSTCIRPSIAAVKPPVLAVCLICTTICFTTTTVSAGAGKGGKADSVGDYTGGSVADEVAEDLAFEETGAAFLGSGISLADSSVGYIDSAIVGTQLCIRFDAAYDFDDPDRAEFFYSTFEEFGGQTQFATIGPNNNLDSQAVALYYEQALGCRFSAFVEAAALFNNPSGIPGPGPNEAGFGDMIAGVKYGLWQGCDSLLTFQLKNYIPTGEEAKWLTAGHYSIEPGLLYFQRLDDCWVLEAEIRDWIPIGGADGLPLGNGQPFAGNVLRYGIGVSYAGFRNSYFSLTPVVELVGWSVLEGQKFDVDLGVPVDADGDDIINLKVGARLARCGGCGDFYLGYGTALTDEAWYNDIVRAMYRITY